MSLFDRLADHITPLTLIYLLGAMAAAGWLGIVVMLLRDHLADAWRGARRRYLAVRGDAFADEPGPEHVPADHEFGDDACALTLAIGPEHTRIRTDEEFDAELRAWLAHEPGRRD